METAAGVHNCFVSVMVPAAFYVAPALGKKYPERSEKGFMKNNEQTQQQRQIPKVVIAWYKITQRASTEMQREQKDVRSLVRTQPGRPGALLLLCVSQNPFLALVQHVALVLCL